ncbi:MAG: hypothetical protein GF383_12425, partial [Candidatus Lokiarchaeota archaeon]|nr:hypothetical protein [Candidatus Lokiarchaeota archaeon]MBD3341807.1 hypothetical protein [Candidatus Lokiarchaeota archaeon]
MSKKLLSKHIPDLTFMTMIAQSNTSWLHKVSPWTKLILMFLGILLLILISNLVTLLLLYLIIVIIYISARLPVKNLKDWYYLPTFITLTIAVPLTINTPGRFMIFYFKYSWFELYFSNIGLESLLVLLIRALASVTLSFIFIMTTKYKEIAFLVHTIFPKGFADIFLLSYRYIFLMLEEISGRIIALKLRGGTSLSYFAHLKKFGALIALSMINGIERGTRLAKAMEIRGGGSETIYVNENVKKPHLLDLIIIGLIIFIIVNIALFDV